MDAFRLIDFEFATILDEEDKAGEHEQIQPRKSSVGRGADFWSRLTVNWSGMTDVGRFRPNNEDAFLTIAFDCQDFHRGREGSAVLMGRT